MDMIKVTVEAKFHSTVDPVGIYTVEVHSTATVDVLLRVVCEAANVPVKSDYFLQTRERRVFSRSDDLRDVGIHDGAYLLWESDLSPVTSQPYSSCKHFCMMAALCLVLSAIVAGLVVAYFKVGVGPVISYAVVFDAGSSHTSMFIYKWDGAKTRGTAVAEQFEESCKSPGGAISSYASDPSKAGASLKTCLDQAVKLIPEDRHAKTPVYLGATAGMRLLREQNESASAAILESVRATLKSYPFLFSKPQKMVRILPGASEGEYSWITSNYVTNSFNVQPPTNEVVPRVITDSLGALDLGGASTQISFIPANGTVIPKGFSKTTRLFGKDYEIYTHSYLCYGENEAHRRILAALITNADIIYHPCYPDGYNVTKTHSEVFGSPCVSGQAAERVFGRVVESPLGADADRNYTFVGTGNPLTCGQVVESTMFNFSTPCPYDRCSFNGVYQPNLQGPFYAFSSFFYNAEFFNLTTPKKDYFSYTDFLTILNTVCRTSWAELIKIPEKKQFLPLYCQNGNYMNSLLVRGYGFTQSQWKDIHFVKKVFGTEIGWTTGLVLDESAVYSPEVPEPSEISTVAFVLLMCLVGLFVLAAIGFVFYAVRAWRGPRNENRQNFSYGAI